jgi:hypothetical protein
MNTNKELLTWNEWKQAAGLAPATPELESAKRAWRAGEDPTEWCASSLSRALKAVRAVVPIYEAAVARGEEDPEGYIAQLLFGATDETMPVCRQYVKTILLPYLYGDSTNVIKKRL